MTSNEKYYIQSLKSMTETERNKFFDAIAFNPESEWRHSDIEIKNYDDYAAIVYGDEEEKQAVRDSWL
jgi:hypothetical protein